MILMKALIILLCKTWQQILQHRASIECPRSCQKHMLNDVLTPNQHGSLRFTLWGKAPEMALAFLFWRVPETSAVLPLPGNYSSRYDVPIISL
mmetsp:Transcript_40320/g.121458  ORF Transcript_40320/g.121458 Transcript_40320/m.121458 type:complete len:93 (-) Transcript_40320:3506-3784(-)